MSQDEKQVNEAYFFFKDCSKGQYRQLFVVYSIAVVDDEFQRQIGADVAVILLINRRPNGNSDDTNVVQLRTHFYQSPGS